MKPNPTSPERNGSKRNVLRLIRVSSDAQDTGRQYDETDGTAEEHNLHVFRTLELHGVSGTAVFDHNEVQKILTELKTPTISGLLLSAWDRGFRPKNFRQMQNIEAFVEIGKPIFTTREGEIDPTTDSGWELLMTLSTRAGAELREMRRRSISGKLKNAKKGNLNSGSVPFGFRYVYRDRSKGTRGHMVIEEAEAEIVRRVFTWIISGLGVYAIAKRLNLEGVPSQRAGQVKNKKTGELNSGQWSQGTIFQMVTNSAYMGRFLYPKGSPDAIEINCSPIVDEATWKHAQLILKGNKEARRGRHSRKYLLSGLCWCRYCGHRFTTKPRSLGRGYYLCGNTSNKPPITHLCTGPNPCFDQQALEDSVWKTVWAGVTEPDTLYNMVEIALQQQAPDVAELAKITELQAQLARLVRAEQRAYENCKDPEMPRDQAKRDWQDAQSTRRQIEFQLQHLQGKARATQTPDKETIEAIARELAGYEPESFEERRMFLQLLIREIRIGTDEMIIQCHIPENSFNEFPRGYGGGERKAMQKSTRREYAKEISSSPFSSPLLTSPISFDLLAKL